MKNMKNRKSILLSILLSAVALIAFAGCATGPNISIQPEGICATSEDGKFRVCYDPFTKGYTVKAAVPGGIATSLSYDSATKEWRGTRPDGTVIVYAGGRVSVIPAPAK